MNLRCCSLNENITNFGSPDTPPVTLILSFESWKDFTMYVTQSPQNWFTQIMQILKLKQTNSMAKANAKANAAKTIHKC